MLPSSPILVNRNLLYCLLSDFAKDIVPYPSTACRRLIVSHYWRFNSPISSGLPLPCIAVQVPNGKRGEQWRKNWRRAGVAKAPYSQAVATVKNTIIQFLLHSCFLFVLLSHVLQSFSNINRPHRGQNW